MPHPVFSPDGDSFLLLASIQETDTEHFTHIKHVTITQQQRISVISHGRYEVSFFAFDNSHIFRASAVNMYNVIHWQNHIAASIGVRNTASGYERKRTEHETKIVMHSMQLILKFTCFQTEILFAHVQRIERKNWLWLAFVFIFNRAEQLKPVA